jgi:hypothetical protein
MDGTPDTPQHVNTCNDTYKGSSTIHQGRLLLPLQQIDTNPTELLQTVLSSKDTEPTIPNGVVVIPVVDMGILLTHYTQFEKVSLGTVWKDLLRVLTLPPTVSNLKFLKEEESEEIVMEFIHDYNDSEAHKPHNTHIVVTVPSPPDQRLMSGRITLEKRQV